MSAFLGINSAVDVGIVTYVSAHKVKVKFMGENNPSGAGITLYVDVARSTCTTYVLTATLINDGVSTTDEYELDSSSTTTPAAVSKTFSTASRKLVWPIALPCDANAWLVLTGTYTGSAPDSSDTVKIEARRDTISGK
jgi:hypothetical protein